jgi:hypothetical protein
MSTEGTRPEDDLDQLKKHKERAELRAQIAALGAPWWRKAGILTAMTGIIAAVLPVTKVIEEHYRNEREHALEAAKAQNDLRMAYLDRYEVPGHRLRTLRFLIATTDDPRLRSWAETEVAFVKEELAVIERQLAAVSEKIRQTPAGPALDELQKRQEELNRLKDMATLVPPRPAGAGSAGAGSAGAGSAGAGSAGAGSAGAPERTP